MSIQWKVSSSSSSSSSSSNGNISCEELRNQCIAQCNALLGQMNQETGGSFGNSNRNFSLQRHVKRESQPSRGGNVGWESVGLDQGFNIAEFRAQHLNNTNYYRNKHGAESLSLHEELNKYAQDWANALAKANVSQHRPDNKYGENITAGRPLSSFDAVQLWYDEEAAYDYRTGNYSPGTGHFTQLVWKNSRYVGVGVAKSSQGLYYIVANYYPAGNFTGEFISNVGHKS
ncbi:hypothetical protein L596_009156 [Steinernema carpocapsae]|uniref:SCP domain-containing protein n=1 Tax=Steinernema carpocapsae TaxID=34508 RepID=A0A4U5PEJ1_STECR|nr:hypothetical protein L596_009156 [Steinernema carpocapsae]